MITAKSENNLTSNDLLAKNASNDIIIIIRDLLLLFNSRSNSFDKKKAGIYLQILRVTLKEPGTTIMDHIFTHGGFTETEIVKSYGLRWDTVTRVISILKQADVVKLVGYVQAPYARTRGRQAKIYLLDGSPPECAHEAQRRFGEIMKARGGEKMDQKTLDEAFNLVKLYLEKRETNRVPEIQIIKMILKENEIKGVEIPLIVNRLRKEGYKW